MNMTMPLTLTNSTGGLAACSGRTGGLWSLSASTVSGQYLHSSWALEKVRSRSGAWRRNRAVLRDDTVARNSLLLRRATISTFEHCTPCIWNSSTRIRLLYIWRYASVCMYVPRSCLRSTVVERWSLTGRLSLSCARPAADGWPLK